MNRSFWCLYNSSFVALWVIEKFVSSKNGSIERLKKYIGMIIAVMLLVMAVIEVFCTVVKFISYVF